MNKQLLLKATEYNWDLIGPGDWTEKIWLIYRDGSYEIISHFTPLYDENRIITRIAETIIPLEKKKQGMMDIETFDELCELLKCEQWRDSTVCDTADDGVAWTIESYTGDGNIDKTSGEIDYILGHRILENIVGLLPE
ncbi:hypothetical protein SAMN06297422_10711 [Lachnospiraceae bacterium]|nr:hypothetical protein SAMN06297422_10711 [Lachnospiraceae bacterium]